MLSAVDSLFRRSRGALDGTHPAVEQALATGVRWYATAWIGAASSLSALKHDAAVVPTRLYEVDPASIERTASWTTISADRKADELPRFRRPKYRLAGRVWGGDWDREADSLAESTVQQSFAAHFAEGVAWEETDFFSETLAAVHAGASPWDCEDRADLRQRCRELDSIYEQMATEGYLTQDQLHERGADATSPHPLYRRIWGEIAVNVGRDGGLIFQDGHNRLAIARALGVERVPVVILVRHREWQRLRDQVARGDKRRGDLPERHRSHPDLRSLF